MRNVLSKNTKGHVPAPSLSVNGYRSPRNPENWHWLDPSPEASLFLSCNGRPLTVETSVRPQGILRKDFFSLVVGDNPRR